MFKVLYSVILGAAALGLLLAIIPLVALLAIWRVAGAIYRKLELHVLYNGDEAARRKYEWRMH